MTYPGTLCSYMLLYDKAYEEFVSLNQAKDDVYLHFRAAAWRALQVVYELKGFPAPSGFDLSGVDALPGRPIINTSDIPRFLDKCRNKVGNYYKESCAILRCWKHDLERAVMLLCDMGLEVLLPYDELNKVLGEITENNLNFFSEPQGSISASARVQSACCVMRHMRTMSLCGTQLSGRTAV